MNLITNFLLGQKEWVTGKTFTPGDNFGAA